METEVLREFLVVANLLNYRKAASKLHLSQSALSKHIVSLESELGFQLFKRQGGTKLTAQGERFYVCAQRILDVVDEGLAECKSMGASAAPVLIQYSGAESYTLERVLMSIETPFKAVKPDFESPILDTLESGQVDIVVVYNAEDVPELLAAKDSGVEYALFAEERLSLLASRDNPIVKHGDVQQEDLPAIELLLPYGSVFMHVDAALQAQLGEELKIKIVHDPSLHSSADLPFCNLGGRFKPGFLEVNREICKRQPAFIAVEALNGTPMLSKGYFAYRSDNPNPNVRSFIDEACRVAKRMEREDGQPDKQSDAAPQDAISQTAKIDGAVASDQAADLT